MTSMAYKAGLPHKLPKLLALLSHFLSYPVANGHDHLTCYMVYQLIETTHMSPS